MPKFGEKSLKELATCHQDLQDLFKEVIRWVDCVVLEGHRNKEKQDAAVAAGNSKTPWPTGKHNSLPSKAVDVMPYPLDWKDTNRIYMFVGFVRATALQLGIKLRCGADWNGDWQTKDQNFHDLPHFELVDD